MSVEDERVRWRCRRGLLELDLVLSKFLDKHYRKLSNSQRTVFNNLLDWPDNDLWDLLSGRSDVSDPDIRKFIELFE
jgi:antitoxin CptB